MNESDSNQLTEFSVNKSHYVNYISVNDVENFVRYHQVFLMNFSIFSLSLDILKTYILFSKTYSVSTLIAKDSNSVIDIVIRDILENNFNREQILPNFEFYNKVSNPAFSNKLIHQNFIKKFPTVSDFIIFLIKEYFFIIDTYMVNTSVNDRVNYPLDNYGTSGTENKLLLIDTLKIHQDMINILLGESLLMPDGKIPFQNIPELTNSYCSNPTISLFCELTREEVIRNSIFKRIPVNSVGISKKDTVAFSSFAFMINGRSESSRLVSNTNFTRLFLNGKISLSFEKTTKSISSRNLNKNSQNIEYSEITFNLVDNDKANPRSFFIIRNEDINYEEAPKPPPPNTTKKEKPLYALAIRSSPMLSSIKFSEYFESKHFRLSSMSQVTTQNNNTKPSPYYSYSFEETNSLIKSNNKLYVRKHSQGDAETHVLSTCVESHVTIPKELLDSRSASNYFRRGSSDTAVYQLIGLDPTISEIVSFHHNYDDVDGLYENIFIPSKEPAFVDMVNQPGNSKDLALLNMTAIFESLDELIKLAPSDSSKRVSNTSSYTIFNEQTPTLKALTNAIYECLQVYELSTDQVARLKDCDFIVIPFRTEKSYSFSSLGITPSMFPRMTDLEKSIYTGDFNNKWTDSKSVIPVFNLDFPVISGKTSFLNGAFVIKNDKNLFRKINDSDKYVISVVFRFDDFDK